MQKDRVETGRSTGILIVFIFAAVHLSNSPDGVIFCFCHPLSIVSDSLIHLLAVFSAFLTDKSFFKCGWEWRIIVNVPVQMQQWGRSWLNVLEWFHALLHLKLYLKVNPPLGPSVLLLQNEAIVVSVPFRVGDATNWYIPLFSCVQYFSTQITLLPSLTELSLRGDSTKTKPLVTFLSKFHKIWLYGQSKYW